MPDGVDGMGDENRRVMLRWFMYHLPMEQRYKLMKALPEAYNEWAGREVVKVVRVSDGTEV